MSEVAESRVRYYAENALGLAQNLLCFFLGECADAPPIPVGGAARVMETSDNAEMSTVYNELKTLNIYPNPTQGKFTITSTEYEEGTIVILDLNGRIVYRMDYSENKRNIDLTEVESGIYLVQLVNNGELVGLEKLIKQ